MSTATNRPLSEPAAMTGTGGVRLPLRATVLSVLPNAMFRLRLQDGSEATGHVGGDMRMRISRLVPGDQVPVEPAPFDPGRVRISGPPVCGGPQEHQRGQP